MHLFAALPRMPAASHGMPFCCQGPASRVIRRASGAACRSPTSCILRPTLTSWTPFWHPSFLGPAWRRRTVMHAPWSIVRPATPHFFVSLSLWARPCTTLSEGAPRVDPCCSADALFGASTGLRLDDFILSLADFIRSRSLLGPAGFIHLPGCAWPEF